MADDAAMLDYECCLGCPSCQSEDIEAREIDFINKPGNMVPMERGDPLVLNLAQRYLWRRCRACDNRWAEYPKETGD